MWPLQIFKTLHWRNVCLARSVTLSCKFVVFGPGFNALIQTVKVSSRSGTRHNYKNSLYGSRWQMAAVPKSSKNNLEASFGWTATVQELSTCQWHHGLQQIKGGAAGQTFRHACTACTVFDTSTSKYQKKKQNTGPRAACWKQRETKSSGSCCFPAQPIVTGETPAAHHSSNQLSCCQETYIKDK